MKTIKGDWVLEADTVLDESVTVEGNIRGKGGKRFDLTVRGNIYARDIDAWDIDARDIDAQDIHARDIICVSRKKKSKGVKTIAYSIILDRFNRELKEVMPEPSREGAGS